jgi:hypothetical protein
MIDPSEARALDSIDVPTHVGLWDRALIALNRRHPHQALAQPDAGEVLWIKRSAKE